MLEYILLTIKQAFYLDSIKQAKENYVLSIIIFFLCFYKYKLAKIIWRKTQSNQILLQSICRNLLKTS